MTLRSKMDILHGKVTREKKNCETDTWHHRNRIPVKYPFNGGQF